TYHTCKHLVAVLLKISEQKPQTKEWTDQMTSSFMDGIESGSFGEVDVLTDKLPMHVEYMLKIDVRNKIWLEWKTGIDHRYIVRNIRDFLDQVLSNEHHLFTKKFSYNPEDHYFLQQDIEIFE